MAPIDLITTEGLRLSPGAHRAPLPRNGCTNRPDHHGGIETCLSPAYTSSTKSCCTNRPDHHGGIETPLILRTFLIFKTGTNRPDHHGGIETCRYCKTSRRKSCPAPIDLITTEGLRQGLYSYAFNLSSSQHQ